MPGPAWTRVQGPRERAVDCEGFREEEGSYGRARFKHDRVSTLSKEQIAKLGRYAGAAPKEFRAGGALFRTGDRDFKFFVVRSGEVEIVDITGEPKTVTIHHAGSFTGDVGHLTGNPAVVSGIAKTDCKSTNYRARSCISS